MAMIEAKKKAKRKAYMKKYQRNWMRKRRSDWIASKGGKCVQCNSKHKLHIDHIDQSQKAAKISHLWSRKKEIREAELAKCQLLCEECHFEKTGKQNYNALVRGKFIEGEEIEIPF